MRDDVLTLSAPAKVNLWLRILGRRDDGFHELETRIATLTLADELTLQAMRDGGLRFACPGSDLPAGESNLVVRACRAVEAEVHRTFDVAITLTKRIPHGAGLGGGSSDAAATIRGLDALFGLELEPETQRRLAAGIGSDVAFFLDGGVCDCRGRGEIVTPVQARGSRPVLLVKPPFAVPTPWAYRHWKESREIPGAPYAAFDWEGVRFVNDLERPVFEKFPVLADLKAWLLDQPETGPVLMSGSGSTVFALLTDPAGASGLEAELQAEFGASFWTWTGEVLV